MSTKIKPKNSFYYLDVSVGKLRFSIISRRETAYNTNEAGVEKLFLREIPQKVLTFPKRCDIIYKRCRKSGRNFAGMAELADARDLKSREIYFSYRFDPGFRHHYIAEWSSLAARRAHNPKVVRFKSHLRNQKNSSDLFRGYFLPLHFFTLHSSLFTKTSGIWR